MLCENLCVALAKREALPKQATIGGALSATVARLTME